MFCIVEDERVECNVILRDSAADTYTPVDNRNISGERETRREEETLRDLNDGGRARGS